MYLRSIKIRQCFFLNQNILWSNKLFQNFQSGPLTEMKELKIHPSLFGLFMVLHQKPRERNEFLLCIFTASEKSDLFVKHGDVFVEIEGAVAVFVGGVKGADQVVLLEQRHLWLLLLLCYTFHRFKTKEVQLFDCHVTSCDFLQLGSTTSRHHHRRLLKVGTLIRTF